ncbi:MAG: hypothetical protein EXX96DRAFT_464607, partial [Benjaminiella poitrasii]
RSHIYASVWDNAFIYNNYFDLKRSECYSNIMKQLKYVNSQRVDFIFYNINDDTDHLPVEEKLSLKGVKKDVKKSKVL